MLKIIYEIATIYGFSYDNELEQICILKMIETALAHENELVEEELYKQILHDKLSINEGMLFENAIAQCLIANGHKLFFYTHYNEEKHRNDIEIDFIISNNSKTKLKLYPIEVKSGKRYTTTSLENFLAQYYQRVGQAYIIHPKNLVVKDSLVCIPSYMSFCL